MNVNEFEKIIVESSVDDWIVKTCWGAGSGPSYLNQFISWTDADDKLINLEVKSHTHIASFKNDLSIYFAWGISHNDNFVESWANKFPDKRAMSIFVDFFYNNNLVYRDIGVAVDGGRCYVPLPDLEINSKENKVERYTVPKIKYDFFRLLNALTSTYDYDRYFDGTGIQIIDGKWFK